MMNNERVVRIGNVDVVLPGKVLQRLDVAGVTIVVLDSENLPDEVYRENLIAFDSNGRKIWSLKCNHDIVHKDLYFPWSLVNLVDQGRVWCINTHDSGWIVDPQTGRKIETLDQYVIRTRR